MILTKPHVPNSNHNPTRVETHTCPVSDSVSLRIYSDTQPHNQKIADLQKGLILVINGTETVGEGTGFGLPVLAYTDETYFSATSKLHISQRANRRIIRKDFTMDRVARNNFRNVTLENRRARSLIEHFSNAYQKHPQLRLLALKRLTQKLNIGTAFPKTTPKGKVTVTYTVENTRTTVKADFKNLEKKSLQRIFMLNEQGTRFFRKYTDSTGTKLTDTEIGAWDTTSGEWACLKTLTGETGFRLWNARNSVLRRGREFLEGSLDWVGLDYEISRRAIVFEYAIDVLAGELH
jgi:hypothetical protein